MYWQMRRPAWLLLRWLRARRRRKHNQDPLFPLKIGLLFCGVPGLIAAILSRDDVVVVSSVLGLLLAGVSLMTLDIMESKSRRGNLDRLLELDYTLRHLPSEVPADVWDLFHDLRHQYQPYNVLEDWQQALQYLEGIAQDLVKLTAVESAAVQEARDLCARAKELEREMRTAIRAVEKV